MSWHDAALQGSGSFSRDCHYGHLIWARFSSSHGERHSSTASLRLGVTIDVCATVQLRSREVVICSMKSEVSAQSSQYGGK